MIDEMLKKAARRNEFGEKVGRLNREMISRMRQNIERDCKESLSISALRRKITRLMGLRRISRPFQDASNECHSTIPHKASMVVPSKKRGRPRRSKNPPITPSQTQNIRSPFSLPSEKPTHISSRRNPLCLDAFSNSELGSPRPRRLTDEELALQLHVDLNAPRLRKRWRRGHGLSPSNSEQ